MFNRDIRNLQGDMHFSSSESANTVTNCMGSLNLLALFGGFLADAKLGRFLAIVLFSSICTIGVTLLTLATAIPSMKPPPCEDSGKCIEANTSQQVMLYISLYTLALGGGGIKSNVSAFGSDQFDKSDAKEEKAMIYSFNRFFFCVSLGSLFATTVMDIQDKEGRKWGYGISAGTMIIALVVLLCGTKFYRYKKPQGSPLTVIWRVMFLAWKKRRLSYPEHLTFLNGYNSSRVPHTDKLRQLIFYESLFEWVESFGKGS